MLAEDNHGNGLALGHDKVKVGKFGKTYHHHMIIEIGSHTTTEEPVAPVKPVDPAEPNEPEESGS